MAFFIGGVTTGATSMWQAADDGVLHGIVMWFAALVGLVGLALALGASAAGGAAGAKMWPKDDVYLERTRVTRS